MCIFLPILVKMHALFCILVMIVLFVCMKLCRSNRSSVFQCVASAAHFFVCGKGGEFDEEMGEDLCSNNGR